jgi:hypothetical protein
MRRTVLYCFIFLFLATNVVAQTACELTLTKAQEEFDAGRFQAVPELLKECLEKNQNREWEERAYLLLAETYLLLENPAKADESYLKVLQANPEFVTDDARDPIDLVYLSKKFTATPIFSLIGKIGLNTSFVRVIHNVQISSQGPVEEEYNLKAGWQAGLGVDYHYSQKLAVNAGVEYAFASFSHNTKNLFNNNFQVFTDRQTWLSVPLTAKFSADNRTLRPFALLGYSANILLRDRASIIIDGDRESEQFDYKYKRTSFASAIVVGAGLKYKWGLRYIFGEVRYNAGLTNIVTPETRFDEYNGINMDWPYADDDFRLDNLSVSIGYVHPFYKARKLKKAKTKSVLRKTKKSNASDNYIGFRGAGYWVRYFQQRRSGV